MRHGSKASIHRNNRLLAALEPEDFLWLEPHLEIVGHSKLMEKDFSGSVGFPTDEVSLPYYP